MRLKGTKMGTVFDIYQPLNHLAMDYYTQSLEGPGIPGSSSSSSSSPLAIGSSSIYLVIRVLFVYDGQTPIRQLQRDALKRADWAPRPELAAFPECSCLDEAIMSSRSPP